MPVAGMPPGDVAIVSGSFPQTPIQAGYHAQVVVSPAGWPQERRTPSANGQIHGFYGEEIIELLFYLTQVYVAATAIDW
jgi:hypothetical protein